ncbi:MAG: HU family DNA-binding protein [Chloroflexi bacterium]|nr:HU family DNA-binding protein [Chloroflexota bacterium]MDA8188771.1 HU family DNA-binding protein [Dehalococcoidales bacterium]
MLSKSDLTQSVAKKTNMSKAKTNEIVGIVLDTITDSLAKGEQVRLTGFGTFRVTKRAARMARNPRTGEPIKVPASRRPAFSPGTKLVSSVRGEKRKAA